MKHKYIAYTIIVMVLFSYIAQAELSAPTVNRAGARLWGTYYDLLGEIGIRNGTLSLIHNITDYNGKYYLKNNSILCGVNTICTYDANGSVSIASTGGGGGNASYPINLSNSSQVIGNLSQTNISELVSDLAGKEPTISTSTASKFYGWDKTWKDIVSSYISDFNSAVNITVDKNLSNYTNAPGFVTNTTMDRNLSNATGTVLSARLDNNQRRRNIAFIISGGGSTITTGIKGYFRVGFNGTLQLVTLVSNETASMTVNIWKDTYANFPPTSADNITGGTPVTLTNTKTMQNTTLAGWTTTVSRGDWFAIQVGSVDTTTLATLDLDYLED